jgi:hypothetical protein
LIDHTLREKDVASYFGMVIERLPEYRRGSGGLPSTSEFQRRTPSSRGTQENQTAVLTSSLSFLASFFPGTD